MLKSILIRILPFVMTALLCALGISLGNWQTRRAEEKEVLAQLIQEQMRRPAEILTKSSVLADLPAFQRLKLRGQFVSGWPLYLDNRPLHGVAGFYVLMPFKLQDSDVTILVARGWRQRNPAERTKMPELLTNEGPMELEGVIRDHLDRTMQLGQSEILKAGAIIQSLSLVDLRKQSGLKIVDKVLEQTSDMNDGLVRDWPKPSVGSDKHRAYAFQWYGLALMAAIFFVVTGIRRGKRRQ
ncbi:SURF1 family protein [Undibacterium sp. Di24W]|uniref:SURF1 family protein n=1 Tax=Undibacterium sp. Di24W TaxID=3413033 RepID=UPI003BF1CD90